MKYPISVCLLINLALPPSGVAGAVIHQWKFAEGTGTVAADSVGAADATITGATWAADRFGNPDQAIQTGYNKWVDPPDTVKTAIGTFAAWIAVDAYGGYNQTPGPVFSAEQGSGASNFSYRLQVDDKGKLIFEAVAPVGTGDSRYAESTTALELNVWKHVAGTYDGYTTRVYINGELAGSSATYETYAGMDTSTGIRVGIGHLEGWSVQWFQGKIDDACVYDSVLSGTELQALAGLWHGYPVVSGGWVDTTPWINWVNATHAPWIWVNDLSKYVYFASGSNWAYVPD